MYIIPNSTQLTDLSTCYRIGIQGAGGSGKTTAALTFPNPVVADIDNNVDLNNALAAGVDPKTVSILKFHDKDFLRTIPASNPKDGIEIWLTNHLSKLDVSQTFILDSWTFLQDAFDLHTPVPISKSSGAEDWMAWWGLKQDYSQSIMKLLQSCKCNVIVLFHEVAERNDKGTLTGRVNPLMQGRFADKLHNYFPYWFRQFALDKITDPEKIKTEIAAMGITHEQFTAIQASSSMRQPSYIWQTVTSNIAKCKTKFPFARFVPANYKSFIDAEMWRQK